MPTVRGIEALKNIRNASGHFFDTRVENLRVFGDAARECGY